MNAYINICICMHIHTYTYIHAWQYVCACMCVCVYVCVLALRSGRALGVEARSRDSKWGLLRTARSSPTYTTLRSSRDITASLTAPECRSTECRYALCPAPDTGPHSSLITRATASLAFVPAAAAHEKWAVVYRKKKKSPDCAISRVFVFTSAAVEPSRLSASSYGTVDCVRRLSTHRRPVVWVCRDWSTVYLRTHTRHVRWWVFRICTWQCAGAFPAY